MRLTLETKPPNPWMMLFMGYILLGLNGLMVWENANNNSMLYITVSSIGVIMSLITIHFSSKRIAYNETIKRSERNPNLDRVDDPNNIIAMRRDDLASLLDTRYYDAVLRAFATETKWEKFKRWILRRRDI